MLGLQKQPVPAEPLDERTRLQRPGGAGGGSSVEARREKGRLVELKHGGLCEPVQRRRGEEQPLVLLVRLRAAELIRNPGAQLAHVLRVVLQQPD
eukprot:4538240-Prymnesium_polylepis.1